MLIMVTGFVLKQQGKKEEDMTKTSLASGLCQMKLKFITV